MDRQQRWTDGLPGQWTTRGICQIVEQINPRKRHSDLFDRDDGSVQVPPSIPRDSDGLGNADLRPRVGNRSAIIGFAEFSVDTEKLKRSSKKFPSKDDLKYDTKA